MFRVYLLHDKKDNGNFGDILTQLVQSATKTIPNRVCARFLPDLTTVFTVYTNSHVNIHGCYCNILMYLVAANERDNPQYLHIISVI